MLPKKDKKGHIPLHLLALVANTTNNIVIITDHEGKVEWVNDTFTTTTGYAFEEIIGKKPGALLQGPDTNPDTRAYISEQLANANAFKDLEILNYHKDKSPYWISLSIQPIFDESGKLSQFIAIQNDITKRKKAQMALAEREKRFSNLVHQSPMGIIEWDTGLNIVEWNESAERIFGYSRNEALGKNAYGFILAENYKVDVENVVSELIQQKGGDRSTNENITKRGEVIFCEWYNRPLLDENGKTVGIISMVEEITEKLKAENLLKESELKFRQVVQNSPLGIYLYEVNDQGQLVLVDINSAADVLTGVDNTALLGMTVEEAFPGLKGTRVPDHYMKAARDGKPWFSDNLYYQEGKISGNFQVSAFQAGKNRVAVVFKDITDRIKNEQQLKKTNAELTKINIELDRFVYSASHDLRAPIASLLGLIKVARLEKDKNALDKIFELQEQSLFKLDNFIQDIVNYSRNNRIKVEITEINFQNLINESFSQLEYINQFKKVEQRTHIHPGLNFRSDGKRLQIVINNLLSNALKYVDILKDNPFIEVNVEKAKGGIKLSITDNGIGIEKEHQPKIFDMFYRGTQLSKGSGIGLYIVQEIVEKLKGTIEVSSQFGVETTFIVYLPSQELIK